MLPIIFPACAFSIENQAKIFSEVLDNAEVSKYKDFFDPIEKVLARYKGRDQLIAQYKARV